MTIRTDIRRLFLRLYHSRVLENFGFLSAANVFGSLIGLILYPFVIRVLGTENYGLYAFAVVIATYPSMLCTYGFHLPASQRVVSALNLPDLASRRSALSSVVSTVFTAQLLLVLACFLVFLPLALFVPVIHSHLLLFLLAWCVIINELLHPVWYFQATKRMRVSSSVSLAVRALSVPLTFVLVRAPDDNLTFMAIVIGTTFVGSLFAFAYMLLHDGIRLRRPSFSDVWNCYRVSTPYFIDIWFSSLKLNTLHFLVGALFGMRQLAILDLASKIINIPRYLAKNINAALFPEVWRDIRRRAVRRLLRAELLIGVAITLVVIALAYPLTLFLGGKPLFPAFPLSLILAPTIFAWFVVDGYVHFVFTPTDRSRFVSANQLVAFCSWLLLFFLAYFFTSSLFVSCASLTLSALGEVLFCHYVTRRHRLLSLLPE